jgi:hypothetical protein
VKQFKDTKYYVESDGRVYSEHSKRYLKPHRMKNGYWLISLGANCKQLVHRLVAIVYLENPNNLKEVNHKDGNKDNNTVDNLEWCTRKHNCQHALETGLRVAQNGSNHCHAILNEEKVRQIREIHGTNKYSCREIGEMFGVKGSTVDYIIHRKAWKHVK